MSSFDDREKAFENKYKHDQDLLFRIHSRRAKLIGLWAAQQLGLTAGDADAYAKMIVQVDMDEPGYQDIVRRLRQDFAAKGLEISDHRIEKELESLLEIARKQVATD
ncbi:MAG: DUF1476 family protein [Azospirillum sp.]|nr:DUF1476 family protein [Azospirillum sp.]